MKIRSKKVEFFVCDQQTKMRLNVATKWTIY